MEKKSVPPERLEHAFWGEAERILEQLQRKKPESVWGNFHLPRFKKRNEYSEEEKKKIKGLQRTKKESCILAIAETQDELFNAIPEEWRRITNEHHKVTDA